MDGLHDTNDEHRKAISLGEWKSFLRDFVDRNKGRRSRFDIFRANGSTEEEGVEAHLEEIIYKNDGTSKNVEVLRIDKSGAEPNEVSVAITNLRGISVQYDTDGSEDVLEFTDNQNTLISLRLESKVDGAS